MKRKAWLFLGSLILGFGAGMIAACAQDVPGEVLKNPGFDEGAPGKDLPAGWSASPKHIRWREKVFMGKDYEIISQPGAYVLATQDIRLKPKQRYTITLTLKGEGGALGGALIVHGPDKPTREMPILWNIQPTSEYEKYVGTFTAIGKGCRIVGTEIEHSIVLEGSTIVDIGSRIDESLIGREVKIYKCPPKPSVFRFMVGDKSEIGIK